VQATTLSPAVPKIAVVAPPAPFRALDGTPVPAAAVDLVARVVSLGRIHRAFALTAAMCLAVAARIDGTVVHEASTDAGPGEPEGDVRLGHPSGVLAVAARVAQDPGMPPVARTVTVYRTARRLMDGFVLVPV
jgi:2-methylaconitate cis-trans-isomerase PrpF